MKGLKQREKWTQEEIEVLKGRYARGNIKTLAEELKRLERAVRSKAAQLGLRRENKMTSSGFAHWSKEEDEWLWKHREVAPGKLAKDLGRSPGAVEGRLSTLRARLLAAQEERIKRTWEIKLELDKRCNLCIVPEMGRGTRYERKYAGKIIGDYERHILFCHEKNGRKESFLKADIITGRIEIKY